MQTLEVNVNGDQKELIIRQGEAEKIRQKKGYSQECSLMSIVDFYGKRVNDITAANSTLIVDRNKATAKLTINDQISEEQIVLNGKLQEDKDYIDLGINDNKLFNEKDLENAFRKRPHLFINTDAYNKVMSSLRNFKGEVKSVFEKSDNRTGNQKVSGSVDVVTDGMEKEIQLKISPWVGIAKKTYNVKVYVTSDSGSPAFYLECVDLMLEKQESAEQALSEVEKALTLIPILYV